MAVIAHRGASLRARIVRLIVLFTLRLVMTIAPVNDRTLRLLGRLEPLMRPAGVVPSGVTVEKITIAGVPGERIRPEGAGSVGSAEGARRHPGTALAYYHGGAFIGCGLDTHRWIAAQLAKGLGVDVYSVDYRQYPDGGVGTSVRDGYAAYRELLDGTWGEYRRVVVAGDSAGGFVAAKVCAYAARDEVAKPAVFVGFSPFLNIGNNPKRSSRRDPMLPIRKVALLGPIFERGPEPLDGPLDMTGDATAGYFPPTVQFAAHNEALIVDATDLAASLDRAGVPNELHVYDGQVHAFVVGAGLTPESWDAYRTAVKFVDRVLTEDERRADQAA
jgi:monoterpene epsilon-lactone hydrolase